MVHLVESEGVGARLGPYPLDTPHSVRLEDFDQPGVPGLAVEARLYAIAHGHHATSDKESRSLVQHIGTIREQYRA